MFRSQHFYTAQHIGAMIKSPVQLFVQLTRTLELVPTALPQWIRAAAAMGQLLYFPPSVKGWEVGRAWINTSTLLTRQNMVIHLLAQHPPKEGRRPRRPRRQRDKKTYNAIDLLEPSRDGDAEQSTIDADTASRQLAAALLSIEPDDSHVEAVRQFFREHHERVNEQTVRGAIILIAAMPEFQLC